MRLNKIFHISAPNCPLSCVETYSCCVLHPAVLQGLPRSYHRPFADSLRVSRNSHFAVNEDSFTSSLPLWTPALSPPCPTGWPEYPARCGPEAWHRVSVSPSWSREEALGLAPRSTLCSVDDGGGCLQQVRRHLSVKGLRAFKDAGCGCFFCICWDDWTVLFGLLTWGMAFNLTHLQMLRLWALLVEALLGHDDIRSFYTFLDPVGYLLRHFASMLLIDLGL